MQMLGVSATGAEAAQVDGTSTTCTGDFKIWRAHLRSYLLSTQSGLSSSRNADKVGQKRSARKHQTMGTMVAMAHVALQPWLPSEHPHRLQPKLLNWQGPPSRCSDAMCAAAALSASFRPSRRQALLCRAASEVEGPDFDLSQYVEGKVFESEPSDRPACLLRHVALV